MTTEIAQHLPCRLKGRGGFPGEIIARIVATGLMNGFTGLFIVGSWIHGGTPGYIWAVLVLFALVSLGMWSRSG
jgi:hypothetical protein